MTDTPMTSARMRRIRRLSAVPRWSGTPMLRHQSVLEHTAQIMPIALWLAGFHRSISLPRDTGEILLYCLVHDESESISGDFMSPFKGVIGTEVKLWEGRRGYGQTDRNDIRNLVKVADCLEALIFASEDGMMGNMTLSDIEADIQSKLETAWAQFDWIVVDNHNKFTTGRLIEALWQILNPKIHPGMEGL